MENVQKTYSAFHKQKFTGHTYPTEWVVRTILGKYPKLALNKGSYKDQKILDLGFGDCRNMPLLHNCSFDIYGVEISNEIISLAHEKLAALNISANLLQGTNTSIPFADKFFDYVLACHSCYYVDKGTTFNDNLREVARTLKQDGIFIASLPAPNNFILKDCIELGDGHVEITNDIYGLRNGYVFRTFSGEQDIRDTFAQHFKDIVICHCEDNFWGVQINFFIVVASKL